MVQEQKKRVVINICVMEFFDKSRIGSDYHNMVDDPELNSWVLGRYNNFCACGLAATGDEIVDEIVPGEAEDKELEPVKQKVISLQAWRYVRTAFAMIGVYVVIKFIISKVKK